MSTIDRIEKIQSAVLRRGMKPACDALMISGATSAKRVANILAIRRRSVLITDTGRQFARCSRSPPLGSSVRAAVVIEGGK